MWVKEELVSNTSQFHLKSVCMLKAHCVVGDKIA